MAEGYIKLHRKLLESSVFDNPNVLKVWIWCLLKATHQPHEQLVGLQNVQLLPGQFIFGRDKHSKELRFSRSSLYRYINVLKSLQMLDIKTNNKFSLVTIVNWELYQSLETKADSKTSIKRTANEQQMDTNKNVKNVKNEYNPLTPFETAIEQFKEFRKSIKKPMTDKAVELLLKKLDSLAGDNEQKKIAILDQSIFHGWQGVFALKEDFVPQHSEQPVKRKAYKTIIVDGKEVDVEVGD